MRNLILLSVLALIFSCTSSRKQVKHTLVNDKTFLLTEISTDTTYGLSPTNAVEVGGVSNSEGPLNERRYLNALAGPNGEKIYYSRAGSCCPVKSKNGLMGMALLDNYRVTYEGAKDTVSIYINMYDSGVLKAPVGFTIKK
jgi:hypothetical protein